jgi:hypothetical protein
MGLLGKIRPLFRWALSGGRAGTLVAAPVEWTSARIAENNTSPFRRWWHVSGRRRISTHLIPAVMHLSFIWQELIAQGMFS